MALWFQSLEFRGEFSLCPQIRSTEPAVGFAKSPGDVDHHLGAMPSEQHDAGRTSVPGRAAFFRRRDRRSSSRRIWLQDHS